MSYKTELAFLEKDDKYMYFEVFHNGEAQGTIYVGRVLPLFMKNGEKSVYQELIVSTKQSEEE